ncbi:MAG: DUF302 domain-containing protein [Bacteroidales bacterium]|nr:MAG: DUF302 domain-containing protein [Bacteroidales bacterium]
MMSYYLSKTINMQFEEAIPFLEGELKKEGFGILTEIDMKDTLRKKLDVDFRKYKILGACNPQYAHKALLTEDKIGVLLPCSFIVQELEPGRVEIACINPEVAMEEVENKQMVNIASEVTQKLTRVIEAL